MTDVSIQKRFWNRVQRVDGYECWPWLGHITRQGYGAIQIDGRNFLAHRLSYLINVGIIPDGFVIDHQCANK